MFTLTLIFCFIFQFAMYLSNFGLHEVLTIIIVESQVSFIVQIITIKIVLNF